MVWLTTGENALSVMVWHCVGSLSRVGLWHHTLRCRSRWLPRASAFPSLQHTAPRFTILWRAGCPRPRARGVLVPVSRPQRLGRRSRCRLSAQAGCNLPRRYCAGGAAVQSRTALARQVCLPLVSAASNSGSCESQQPCLDQDSSDSAGQSLLQIMAPQCLVVSIRLPSRFFCPRGCSSSTACAAIVVSLNSSSRWSKLAQRGFL